MDTEAQIKKKPPAKNARNTDKTNPATALSQASKRQSFKALKLQSLKASVDKNGQQNNGQNHRQNQQQDAALVARRLLIARGLRRLRHGAARVVAHPLHVVGNRRQRLPLLGHNLVDLAEEHVDVTDAALNVLDLLLALDNQLFLEVDFVLRRQVDELLLLEELLLLRRRERARARACAGGSSSSGGGGFVGVDGGAGGCYRGLFFF